MLSLAIFETRYVLWPDCIVILLVGPHGILIPGEPNATIRTVFFGMLEPQSMDIVVWNCKAEPYHLKLSSHSHGSNYSPNGTMSTYVIWLFSIVKNGPWIEHFYHFKLWADTWIHIYVCMHVHHWLWKFFWISTHYTSGNGASFQSRIVIRIDQISASN